MALNFPSSPTISQIYTDSVSGFSYEWNGYVWISFSAASSSQIKVLDDISASFNSSTQTFPLTLSGNPVTAPSSQSLRVVLGGIVQAPGTDYIISGSNIIFTVAPTTGLSFSGISLGPAIPVIDNVANVYEKQSYTATASQTLFNFAAGYTVGFLDVYQNGVRLTVGTDFTATNGNTFTLITPANISDEVEAIGYKVATLVSTQGNLTSLFVTGISTFVGIATHTGTIFGDNLSLTGILTVGGTNILTEINTKTSTGKAIAMAIVFG